MLGHREFSIEDYVAIVRRRVWWILIPAVLAPLVAVGISLKLPNRYTSTTLVLVEQQKVPGDFVKSVVAEDLGERLATMQEQIFSRTRLQPIIERFGLYKDEGLPTEEIVERVRKQISIVPVRGDFAGRTGGLPGFYISFTAPSARLAQQVCAEITSMFMDENLRARQQRAQGTTDFLTSQLSDAKQELDQQDAKLAEFKRKYFGQLPEQEQANFNMLNTLNTQLQTANDSMQRLQQQKTYLETMLASEQSASQGAAKGEVSPQTLQQQLSAAEAQLVSLESRYTPNHPDVVKQRNDVASLKKKLEAQRASDEAATKDEKPAKDSADTPATAQLRAQLRSTQQAISDKARDQAKIEQQINQYQSRIQLSPAVEEQFKALTRDYQTALGFYNDLLNKKNQSAMATDLEKRQQGEQFRVMDPPNLPEKPSFPDRPLFAGVGFGFGLALGVGMAFLLELQDKTIRSEQDVALLLELPTMAVIPLVGEPGQKSENKRRFMVGRRKTTVPVDRESVGA